MTPEDTLNAEMRLFVLESLVALLYAAHHKSTADSEASFISMKENLVALARRQTFGALGAAYSDAAAGELEEAVDSALALQRKWLDSNH